MSSIPLAKVVNYCSGRLFVSSSTSAVANLYGYGFSDVPVVTALVFNDASTARHVDVVVKSVTTTQIDFEFSGEFTGYVNWRATDT